MAEAFVPASVFVPAVSSGGSSSAVPNTWGLYIPSVAAGTRPTSPWGTVLTPGNNVYGAYAAVLPATSAETYLMRITLNAFAVAGTARAALVTIGIDPLGGVAYVPFIEHLQAACAHTYIAGPVVYVFPITVPAGASIAAKATVNNATVGTGYISIELWGDPADPAVPAQTGTFVRTFGAVPGTSSGTTAPVGTVSEGAWTQLGGALAEPLHYWEWGMGINAGTILGNVFNIDVGIGDAGTKRVVIHNAYANTTTLETITKAAASWPGLGEVGDLVYVRGQVGPNAADATTSFIAYGVG